MVDMEELVERRRVLNTAERVMDIIKDVTSVYSLVVLSLDPILLSKLALSATFPRDQTSSVRNNELVEQHRKCPKRVHIVDQLKNGTLDHFEKAFQIKMFQGKLIRIYYNN